MFNHHFFEGNRSKKIYDKFLKKAGKMVIVCDPPFGGLVAVLANNLKTINNDWKETENGKIQLFICILCKTYQCHIFV